MKSPTNESRLFKMRSKDSEDNKIGSNEDYKQDLVLNPKRCSIQRVYSNNIEPNNLHNLN
jgi:hypothetical protein